MNDLNTSPAPSTADVETFLMIVEQYDVGVLVTVDVLRDDLEAAQINPTAYGPLFGAACRRGVLTHTGRSHIVRKGSRKGGRASVYKRTRPKTPKRPGLKAVGGAS